MDAKGNIRKSHGTVKKKRLKKPFTTFKVGDNVWRRNITAEQRKGGKLESNYLGPFTIICLEGKSADLENAMGVIFPKINIDHLKHHIELPRVPQRLKKQFVIFVNKSLSTHLQFSLANSLVCSSLASPSPVATASTPALALSDSTIDIDQCM